MIAWVFPGQGHERPGDGRAWLDHPAVRSRLGELSEPAEVDLVQALERGGRAWSRTEGLQPLLTALSLAVSELLPRRPQVVAGHSLGELAAWSATGAIDTPSTVRLARLRGLAMAEAARRRPGGMCVLEGRLPRGLDLAVDNPGQRIASGPLDQLPGPRLPTLGPWHSRAMASARPDYARALAGLRPRPGAGLLVANRDGQPLPAHQDLRPLMLAQLTQPVRWTRCLATLRRMGLEEVWILPPGRLLAQQLRQAGVPARVLDKPNDLEDLCV